MASEAYSDSFERQWIRDSEEEVADDLETENDDLLDLENDDLLDNIEDDNDIDGIDDAEDDMTDDPRPPKILENKPEEDLLFFEFTDDDERLMLVLEEAPVPLTVPLDVVPEAL